MKEEESEVTEEEVDRMAGMIRVQWQKKYPQIFWPARKSTRASGRRPSPPQVMGGLRI